MRKHSSHTSDSTPIGSGTAWSFSLIVVPKCDRQTEAPHLGSEKRKEEEEKKKKVEPKCLPWKAREKGKRPLIWDSIQCWVYPRKKSFEKGGSIPVAQIGPADPFLFTFILNSLQKKKKLALQSVHTMGGVIAAAPSNHWQQQFPTKKPPGFQMKVHPSIHPSIHSRPPKGLTSCSGGSSRSMKRPSHIL